MLPIDDLSFMHLSGLGDRSIPELAEISGRDEASDADRPVAPEQWG